MRKLSLRTDSMEGSKYSVGSSEVHIVLHDCPKLGQYRHIFFIQLKGTICSIENQYNWFIKIRLTVTKG